MSNNYALRLFLNHDHIHPSTFEETKTKPVMKVLVYWSKLGVEAVTEFAHSFYGSDPFNINDLRIGCLYEMQINGLLYDGNDIMRFSTQKSGVVRYGTFRLLPEYFHFFVVDDVPEFKPRSELPPNDL